MAGSPGCLHPRNTTRGFLARKTAIFEMRFCKGRRAAEQAECKAQHYQHVTDVHGFSFQTRLISYRGRRPGSSVMLVVEACSNPLRRRPNKQQLYSLGAEFFDCPGERCFCERM